MILPIEASMHTPRHFDLVLSGTMAAVTALYVAFGAVRVGRASLLSVSMLPWSLHSSLPHLTPKGLAV